MNALLAVGAVGTWGLAEWLIAIIVICAVIGITIIALRVMGITLPQWFWQIAAIVAVCIVAIIAIRFILAL